jgi:fumarate reductase subunit C
VDRPAHPHAMQPKKPGRTRTAPPQLPPNFPWKGRYRSYILFDLTGFLYLILGFLALKVVWALGSGEAAFTSMISGFQNPIYIAFHVLSLVGVIFVLVRFIAGFPKAQPPKMGPLRTPPEPVFFFGLYGAWVVVAAAFAFVLAGGLS